MLRSYEMQRLPGEKHWLNWLGVNGCMRLGWSWLLNRRRAASTEKTFEGIARTRCRLLTQWAEQHWSFLAGLGNTLLRQWPHLDQRSLHTARALHHEVSELFIIDSSGTVLQSTHTAHVGRRIHASITQRALQAPLLHGPYADPLTRELGATTSSFHDDMTLLFLQPLLQDGHCVGCLCARVPNDVMSDLIQREAGHVFPDSGDNYLFMVTAVADPSILPGTALSRSRFEDGTFTGGDNLKDGVHTAFGTVQVRERTELELRFTDPATQQLHPGVRETIRRGQHVCVCYPGYPDYRHIPVVGAGLTFRMPGSPDTWGLLCEGDLEEVYRGRSTSLRLLGLIMLCGAGAWSAAALLRGMVPCHHWSMSAQRRWRWPRSGSAACARISSVCKPSTTISWISPNATHR